MKIDDSLLEQIQERFAELDLISHEDDNLSYICPEDILKFITKVEEYYKASSKGDWRVDLPVKKEPIANVFISDFPRQPIIVRCQGEQDCENAKFIAQAHRDVPILIAYIELLCNQMFKFNEILGSINQQLKINNNKLNNILINRK